MTSPAEIAVTAARDATGARDWICPFCSLLCDGYQLQWATPPRLHGSDCPRARAALQHFPAATSPPSIGGEPVDFSDAADAAAEILGAGTQPLIGGMATDVAGVRSLYRLADACGAILDHVHGDALMHATRALQDRGLFYTTLAEMRSRADLVVCIGTHPSAHYPEFFRRCAPAAKRDTAQQVVLLGAPESPADAAGLDAASSTSVPMAGDIFDTLAQLGALLGDKRIADPDPALRSLSERMRSATYCVLVWESGVLSEQGALVAERILRIIAILNRTTRAASFCLGGSDGGYAANQTVSWLSGLPLRTGVFARGLVHEPLRHATSRLLEEAAVDALLWVSSLSPELEPPATGFPRVVLGHPALGARLAAAGGDVFIPVATPGISADGHLFRADGGVVLPLRAVAPDGLPGVHEVVDEITRRLGGGGR